MSLNVIDKASAPPPPALSPLAARLRQAVQGCTIHSHGPVQAWAAIEDAIDSGEVDRKALVSELMATCRRRLADLQVAGVDDDDPRVKKERLTMRFVQRMIRGAVVDAVDPLEALLEAVAPAQAQVMASPIYTQLTSVERVRVFMESHVFAVWDFMCLLKSLQHCVTCIDPIWRPRGDPIVRRLVNEIVVGEESDVVDGVVGSHFELYLAAMEEIGANTAPIRAFMEAIEGGSLVSVALERAKAPAAAREFVLTTMEIVQRGRPNEIAAAFTLGREQPIPQMFRNIVAQLNDGGGSCRKLLAYLDRHIEVDSHEHGPAAMRLLTILCQDDDMLWEGATTTATTALVARRALWWGICEQL